MPKSTHAAIAILATGWLTAAVPPVAAAPSTTPIWTQTGLAVGSPPTESFSQHLGTAVGTAGDFNCDGVSDLLVGAPQSDFRQFDANPAVPDAGDSNFGWLAVYFGGKTLPAQPTGAPGWSTVGDGFHGFLGGGGAGLGSAVASGDVNRDGCDDVLAIAQQYVGSGPGVLPTIAVYFGSASGPSTSPNWTRTFGAFTVPSPVAEISVSLSSGDLNGDGTADIVVGAPRASRGQSDEGAVLVWLGSQFMASTPTGADNPDWIAESNQTDARLGTGVSTGDVNGDGRDDVLAGAPNFDLTAPIAATDTGRAFLWLGSPVQESAPDGTPANAAWAYSTGNPNIHLGRSVAVLGDVDGDGFADMAMGGPDFDNLAVVGTKEGVVSVARGGNPLPPSDSQSWIHNGQVAGGRLGHSLATAGDVNGDGRADYLMGQPGSTLSNGAPGQAHLVLGRPTSAWVGFPATDVSYVQPGSINQFANDIDRFGASLGTAGDWNDDGFSDVVLSHAENRGVVRVFAGRGESVATTSAFQAEDFAQAGSALGIGLSFAGDINHDGFSDVILGAPYFESGPTQIDEGRIFVHLGGPCGPACGPQEPLFLGDREGDSAGAQLGWSVSGGDVNGDGFADVIAGAPNLARFGFCSPGFCQRNAGQVRVFMGNAAGTGLDLLPSVAISGDFQQGAQFGYSVAGVGDVNGDGYGDVLVGEPNGNAGLANEGRVFLYLGSATGLSTTPNWIKSGGQVGAHFGISVAGAGDINHDGYSDVIIGADGYGGTGAAFVYYGRPTTALFTLGLWNNPIRILLGSQSGSGFGTAVASAGDVNRDGFADVVVGAPFYRLDPDGFYPGIGVVTVHHGAVAGPSPAPDTFIQGDLFYSGLFGDTVSGAGDVDGDGYGDIVIGDPFFTDLSNQQGAAWVHHGSAAGISATNFRPLEDCTDPYCFFGSRVSGGGDANGDGFGDVLISAHQFSATAANAGAVFTHLGNEGRGTPIRALQALAFGGSARAIMGATANNFEASMDLKSAAGRSRVELELEVKPIEADFDGASLLKSGMLENGTTTRASVNYLGTPSTIQAWRARLRSLSPLFGRSRWISLPGNAAREYDIRVLPEPGVGIALAAGLGVLASVGRRRKTAKR